MTLNTFAKLSAAVSVVAMLGASPSLAQDVPLPDYYPDSYAEIVEASRAENGLVVYSNMSDSNWGPIIEGFRELYPWINVETLDLASGAVHSRWEAEAGSGSRTGDFLISLANDRWASYGLEGTQMLVYESPEFAHLPDFAMPYPGVSVLSADPWVIPYNTILLAEDQRPTGFSSLAAIATANSGLFNGRITTSDASRNAAGLAAWWSYMTAKGDVAWENLRAIGPMIRGETSAGTMNEKIIAGEYVVGFPVSGITIFPRTEQPGGEILGFAFPDDGTIVMLRGMGIPKDTANPNSAKLLHDFLLSKEGQTRVGKGGMVPYRDDVEESEVRYTYQGIAEIIGPENMVIAGFDEGLLTEAADFAAQWSAAVTGQ